MPESHPTDDERRRVHAEDVADRARSLQQNFPIDAEAATVTAENQLAKERAKPASQDVDGARAASARASEAGSSQP